MEIPFIDLSPEYSYLRDDIQGAVNRVLESGHFVLSDEVDAFEEEFASYLNVSEVVGLNSGSDALELALDAVGVESGDEVIIPSHTFISTANAIVANGAEPVFVDIDERTYCMDTDQLEAAVTPDTAAIVPVHLYGQPVEMDTIMDVAVRYDLAVVEDACQAHGARYRGTKVGTIGDIGCFSFYPVKNLGAYGDGGALITDDSVIAERVRTARNVGQSKKYYHEMIGQNSRLDELQAAILREKLPHLEKWNDRRRELAALYREELAETDLDPPKVRGYVTHAFHLYVVQHEQRDALRAYLEDVGVQTLIHYPIPVHRQPPYRDRTDTSLPVTERVTDKIISLPLHPWMRDVEVIEVAKKISGFE